MSNNTIYLKDYQPPTFTVNSLSLQVDLFDDHALICNDMVLSRSRVGPLCLNGDELELISISCNGQLLAEGDYRFVGSDLVLEDCGDEVKLQIVTRLRPQDNTQLSGLYRSKTLFCTQCEAEGFRRITFFPDRPDVLTVYRVCISADKVKYPVLLSNGNLIASGDAEHGRHYAVWHDPFKKPSYLFALVAGQLGCLEDEYVTQSGRVVALRIYAEPGMEAHCAHAMQSLKKAMRWDEVEYGREYDLDVFMIVAVSDFNMGAMENKGLNIFNAKYILASPDTATDDDFADIEGVVGHEYFHNWTGNRITCRDWFQLSLKEGLTVFRDQEFSRDMNSRDVNRIGDVKALLATQFPEDAGSMAHPVRPASYQEINNFYTATIYNKGAEVIRMQQTLLGKAGFRKGMDLYFDRHDGQAVTIDDFVAAMEDANGRDLTQFKRWYSQAGTPVVKVRCEFEGNTLTLHCQQSCRPTPECQEKLPFHIPIRVQLFDKQGHAMSGYPEILELTELKQCFIFNDLAEKPMVSLLGDFSAPIRLERAQDAQESLFLLRHETNGYAKWDAARQLTMAHLQQRLLEIETPEQIAQSTLFDAFNAILLDDTLDPALRAELIAPPGFEEVISPLTAVDVLQVEDARDAYRDAFCNALFASAQQVYTARSSAATASATAGALLGRRKLANACLWIMMKADEEATTPLCLKQFQTAQTMTEQLASFNLLAQATNEGVREHAVTAFFKQWSKDELVLDKWFAVQAASNGSASLARVKGLLAHPAFTHKNPNKVRALIGTFVMSNPRHFHAIDGSGYDFLVEQLIILDKINPSIAARLAVPFTRWKRFDSPRQALMKQALMVLSGLELSRDLREMVAKSLEDAS